MVNTRQIRLTKVKMHLANDRARADKQISICIAVIYSIFSLNILLKTIPLLPKSLITQIAFSMEAIAILSGFAFSRQYRLRYFLYPFICWSIVYLVTFLLTSSDTLIVIRRGLWTLFVCIPIGYLSSVIVDKSILFKTLLNWSWIISIQMIVLFLFARSGAIEDYDMSFSYTLLLPLLLHLIEYWNRRKVQYLLAAIVETAMVVLYGSRGPLLSVLIVALLVFILDGKNVLLKIMIIAIVAGILSIGYSYLHSQAYEITLYLNRIGFDSRTINLLLNDIAHDSGRSQIYNMAFDLISQRPIWGWGPGGEVFKIGIYPHNIFLELLIDFGVFAGGILGILVLRMALTPFTMKMSSERDLLIMYLGLGLIPLLISSTYTEDYNFAIFVYLSTTCTIPKAAAAVRNMRQKIVRAKQYE